MGVGCCRRCLEAVQSVAANAGSPPRGPSSREPLVEGMELSVRSGENIIKREDGSYGGQPRSPPATNAKTPMSFAPMPPGQPFANSYEASPSDSFVFVIPGDEQLFVGGGALNGVVGRLLMKEAHQSIPFEIDTTTGSFVKVVDETTGRNVPLYRPEECPYAPMHNKIFERARLKPNVVAVGTIAETGAAPVIWSGARCWNQQQLPFGAVFLNVLKQDQRPFGHPKNMGLMYTVGPLGRNKRAEGEGVPDEHRADLVRHDAKDFVHDLYWTGHNCIMALREYNLKYSSSANVEDAAYRPPRLNLVRLPILSGGTFIHPEVSPMQAALALIWGIDRACRDDDNEKLNPDIELMPEKAMQEAYRLYYEEGAKPADWNTEEKKFLYQKIDINGGPAY